MAKPEVTVRLREGRVIAGTPTTATVRIDFPDATKVNGITARFGYLHRWGYGDSSTSVILPREVGWSLADKQTFPAGSSLVKELGITLPVNSPPSHDLRIASSAARLSIHVDIPWARDVRKAFELPVTQPAQPIVRMPYVVRTDPSGERGVLEVSLASQAIIAGEPLVGKVALYGVAGDREVRIVVMQLLSLVDNSGHCVVVDHNAGAWQATVEIAADKIGREVPFTIALPGPIVPGFTSPTHSLRWVLVAQTGSIFSRRELRVPLLVVPPASRAHAMPLAMAAPSVGDERIAALFAEHARAGGWSTVFAPAHAELRDVVGMEREIDDCVMRIGYDNRGSDGRFVRCSLTYPPLGLGLTVNPSSRARHTFFHDIEVDIAEFDRKHHVVANEAAQAIPYLRAAITALGDVGALGAFEQWGDTSISWLLPATNLELQLPQVLRVLDAVAIGFVASASIIQPPPDIKVLLDRWRALAESYGAHLVVGDLSIRRTPRGQPVSVSIVRDASRRPTHLRVSWGDAALAVDEVKALSLRLPYPTVSLPDSIPERLAQVFTSTKETVFDFELEDGVVSARQEIGGTAPHSIDVDGVRSKIDLLRAALTAVTPQTGPYR